MNIFSHSHRFQSRRRFGHRPSSPQPIPDRVNTLAATPVGSWVRVVGFRPGLAGERRNQLQSYGVAPGHAVKVLQHVPVTVLLIEQFELALEREMAALVEVTRSLSD